MSIAKLQTICYEEISWSQRRKATLWLFWTMAPRAARIKVEAAQKKDVSISGTYKPRRSELRAGAGTTKDILVTIPKGAAVSCYGYYSLYNGKPWYYVKTTVKGVAYTGFCSSAY